MVVKKDPSQVFILTGAIGAAMVVGASLWSAWRAPVAAPGSPESPRDRAPAGVQAGSRREGPAHRPTQEQQPAEIEQVPQQQLDSGRSEKVLSRAFEDAASSENKVRWWSRWLANNPDAHPALRALGRDAVPPDTAPLVPARFNCTTFVETVIALVRSKDSASFSQRLLEVRYRGVKPSFLARNHFPETDWIPNNIASGVLADLTEQVARDGGVTLALGEKTVDRSRWVAEQAGESPEVSRAVAASRSPASAGSEGDEPPRQVRLPYIPAARVEEVAARIPDGAVINFVRKNEAKRPVLISHQGFVVREDGETRLRHSSPKGRIRTVSLRDYLKINHGVVGFTLDRVNE